VLDAGTPVADFLCESVKKVVYQPERAGKEYHHYQFIQNF
jgi:hypothetical protein